MSKDDNIIPIKNQEYERSYSVTLTETEMTTLSKAILKLYQEDKENRLPAENTFHIMRVFDRFSKVLNLGKYTLIKKERLPGG